MTSKEKLDAIMEELVDSDVNDKVFEILKRFATDITKDLEVLDALKRVINGVLQFGNVSGWVEFDLDYEDEYDEQGTKDHKLVKEWLKNDK